MTENYQVLMNIQYLIYHVELAGEIALSIMGSPATTCFGSIAARLPPSISPIGGGLMYSDATDEPARFIFLVARQGVAIKTTMAKSKIRLGNLADVILGLFFIYLLFSNFFASLVCKFI
ncbi:hypothetical protein ACP275_07G048000 [Erythranthe tilingii]